MANDNDGEFETTKNTQKRNEISRVIGILQKQKQNLEDLKAITEILYSDFVLQEDRLIQIGVVMLNTEEKLNFEFDYWLDRIDYYAQIDNVPGMERLLSLDHFRMSGGTYREQLYNALFNNGDGYQKQLKDYALNKIDNKYKKGCGDMIAAINWELEVLSVWINQEQNYLNSIPTR